MDNLLSRNEMGKVILSNRTRKKISQQALGDKLGFTRQAVASWEKGESAPDVITARILAEELDFSFLDLVEKEKPHPPKGSGADVTEDLARLAHGEQPGSVQAIESPTHIMKGYAIGLPGQEQLFIDFLITGTDDRVVLPMIEHRTKNK